MKALSGALAALLSFVLSAPAALSSAAGVALWFLVVDSCAGLWLARRTGTMSSSAFRLKLRDKLACYAMILALSGGVGVIARTWAWPVAGFWALVAGEGISVAETLRAGLKLSDAAWTEPINKLLDKLMGVLDEKAGSIDEKAASIDEKAEGGDKGTGIEGKGAGDGQKSPA